MKRPSRREFLKTAAGGGVAASLPIALRGQDRPQAAQDVPPNERIQIALIGAGGQGMYDTRTALRVPGTELTAVADIYDGRLLRSKELWGEQLFTTRDYREVLARPDVDAVIIATPDHWHARISMDAMKAGKDVYVEKPMMQRVDEGRPVADVARETKRILQVGSQRVSSIVYAKARDLYRAGSIGELNLVEAWINRNSALGAWQYSIPPDASPQTVDWDRFLGHAPKRPFEPIRLFRWRNYRDYGTGIPGDLFVHLFSGIHYVLDSAGPTRIVATGGLRYWNDGRDVPDVMLALYDYPKTAAHPAFTLALRVNFAEGAGDSQAFRFVGPDGVITIGGAGVTLARRARPREPGYTIDTFTEDVQKAFLEQYRAKYPEQQELWPGSEEVYAPPGGYSDTYDHFVNFLDAVRTRKPVVEDAVFGFRAAGPALLTNDSYFEGRPIAWDPEKMKRTSARTDNGGR
ncbi:MAG: Gfo/Idh/MocA family oxidoreductase [Acidobacteria bacterium]|nr:Gfo/Idh/MocA family oxidoreductase [Acidobacteriota bacterium]MCA1650812.1 Gfo/Idh/MocA family oxidoreductase [Acidobacteriota bacterium]